jgi:hypothetical protein
MARSSVMDAAPSAEEIEQFEQIDSESRVAEEEFEREIAAAKGELTQSQLDPLDGCDPRDQRVRDTERDARLRHRDYDATLDATLIPAIRRAPQIFTVLRDTVDAGEAAYALAKILQNPNLAEHPKYRGFQEYLQDVSERRTGMFDGLSPQDHARLLDDYKQHAEEGETINEFFTRWGR